MRKGGKTGLRPDIKEKLRQLQPQTQSKNDFSSIHLKKRPGKKRTFFHSKNSVVLMDYQ